MDKYKPILMILLVVSIPVFIWYGYDTERKEITHCTGMAQKYVIANFSEDYTTTCYDSFSDSYVFCTETRYWHKPASDVWTIYTQNGKVTTNLPHTVVNGVGIPDYPPINVKYSGYDFDGYERISKTNYTITFIDGEHVNEPLNAHRKCMQYLHENIEINTWYGIKYSIDY